MSARRYSCRGLLLFFKSVMERIPDLGESVALPWLLYAERFSFYIGQILLECGKREQALLLSSARCFLIFPMCFWNPSGEVIQVVFDFIGDRSLGGRGQATSAQMMQFFRLIVGFKTLNEINYALQHCFLCNTLPTIIYAVSKSNQLQPTFHNQTKTTLSPATLLFLLLFPTYQASSQG